MTAHSGASVGKVMAAPQAVPADNDGQSFNNLSFLAAPVLGRATAASTPQTVLAVHCGAWAGQSNSSSKASPMRLEPPAPVRRINSSFYHRVCQQFTVAPVLGREALASPFWIMLAGHFSAGTG